MRLYRILVSAAARSRGAGRTWTSLVGASCGGSRGELPLPVRVARCRRADGCGRDSRLGCQGQILDRCSSPAHAPFPSPIPSSCPCPPTRSAAARTWGSKTGHYFGAVHHNNTSCNTSERGSKANYKQSRILSFEPVARKPGTRARPRQVRLEKLARGAAMGASHQDASPQLHVVDLRHVTFAPPGAT